MCAKTLVLRVGRAKRFFLRSQRSEAIQAGEGHPLALRERLDLKILSPHCIRLYVPSGSEKRSVWSLFPFSGVDVADFLVFESGCWIGDGLSGSDEAPFNRDRKRFSWNCMSLGPSQVR